MAWGHVTTYRFIVEGLVPMVDLVVEMSWVTGSVDRSGGTY